jgi:ankyrin repeat protein
LWWITCAKRPLTTLELQHALAVEIGESQIDEDNLPQVEDMISVCAGLATVDKESNIIRLVHYTAQEYFERTQTHWFPDAEINITTTCVTYLLFDVFKSGVCQTDDELEERLRSNPLYGYAAHNWGHHARDASILGQALISSQLIMNFLENRSKVEASSQAMLAYKGGSPHTMGLHVAAYFGLEEAVHALLSSGYGPDLKGTYGRTPLSWAAAKGHEAIVKYLLATGAVEVNLKDTTEYGQTPLLLAAANGHQTVVKLLLENGAELESKDNQFESTPMLWASWRGYDGVVKLLLENGTEPEPRNFYDSTPLSLAAESGHMVVVELLLAKGGIDADSKDIASRTPLSYAAECGYEAIVKLLLATDGVEADSKDDSGRTPLSHAAERGYEAIVKLLLATDRVEADSKDNHSRTPLSWAAENGHEAVVRLLLKQGAQFETKDNSGWTPLSHAAIQGKEVVVQLLLEQGAEFDSKDNWGRTPLLYAARSGRRVRVQR